MPAKLNEIIAQAGGDTTPITENLAAQVFALEAMLREKDIDKDKIQQAIEQASKELPENPTTTQTLETQLEALKVLAEENGIDEGKIK